MQSNYGNFDQAMKVKIDKVSRWMQENNYTTASMHDMLDRNKDGMVDTKEFVDGMASLSIPGLMTRDYVLIFEAIDIDDDGVLTPEEIKEFFLKNGFDAD